MSAVPATASTLDVAVPAVDLVLDVERLRVWLESHGEVLVRRPYLRYKPRTSCVAAVELASGPAFLYGVAEPAQPKLEKLVAKAPPGSVRAVDHDRRLVLAGLDADRDLPAVGNLPRAVAALDLDPTPARSSRQSRLAGLEVLVHKPQRRLVALLPGARAVPGRPAADGAVVLRAYRSRRLEPAVARHLSAGRVEGVRTAEVLAASSRHGLLALAHLPGEPLDGLVAAGSATPELLRATGAALARLHAPLSGTSHRGLASAPGLGRTTIGVGARETAALVSWLCPSLADRLASLLRELAATCPSRNQPVFCHGDFSTDQVIVDDHGRPGLIDWDRAGVGDPAGDLASLRAVGLTDDHFASVLEGYGRLRLPPRHLDWHLAQAQLTRAADPFRVGAQAWRTDIEDHVTAVETDLARVRGARP